MWTHRQAKEIINELLDNCKIAPGQTKVTASIYKKLTALDKHMENTISIEWGLDDVLHQAKEDGVEITEDQALNVLSTMDSKHDASIGMSWDVISEFISMEVNG